MPAYVFRFTTNHGQEVLAEAPILIYQPDKLSDLIQAAWPEIAVGPMQTMVRYVIDAAIQMSKGEGSLSTLSSPMAFGGDIAFEIAEEPPVREGVERSDVFPNHTPPHGDPSNN